MRRIPKKITNKYFNKHLTLFLSLIILTIAVFICIESYRDKLSNLADYKAAEYQLISVTEIPSDWKTFTLRSGSVLFKYPPFLDIRNLGTDDYVFAMPKNETDVMNFSDFRVDATLSQQNSNYDRALKNAMDYYKPYSDVKLERFENGVVKISGFLNGQKAVRSLLKYKEGAVEISHLSSNWLIEPEVFDQIISSFTIVQ